MSANRPRFSLPSRSSPQCRSISTALRESTNSWPILSALGIAVKPLLQELKSNTPPAAHDIPREQRGFAAGGLIIGRLERALIFLFVLIGLPAGVGFLIAAKSVFRFGELREHQHRMEAEYILIGTLMSFGGGLLVSKVTQMVLGMSWS